MRKFKIGDKVQVTDVSGGLDLYDRLPLGFVTIVVDKGVYEDTCTVLHKDGTRGGWLESRFILAKNTIVQDIIKDL